MKNSYIRSHFGHHVYFKMLKNRSFAYLFLYVDNMLIASNKMDNDFKNFESIWLINICIRIHSDIIYILHHLMEAHLFILRVRGNQNISPRQRFVEFDSILIWPLMANLSHKELLKKLLTNSFPFTREKKGIEILLF